MTYERPFKGLKLFITTLKIDVIYLNRKIMDVLR